MPGPEEMDQQRGEQKSDLELQQALARERRSQLRGLLLLALAVLLFLLYRARPLLLFQPNWWRP